MNVADWLELLFWGKARLHFKGKADRFWKRMAVSQKGNKRNSPILWILVEKTKFVNQAEKGMINELVNRTLGASGMLTFWKCT